MCNGNAGVDAGGAEVAAGAALTATGYGSAIGIPLMLSGAGSATNAYAQNQQLKAQNNAAAEGIIKQGQIQQQGGNDVGAATKSVAQSNAKIQAAQASQLASYRTALQQGSGLSQSADTNVAGTSKAFKEQEGTAGASASNYVNALANSAATTEGTQLERVGENETLANTAGQLGALSNQSNEQNYLTKLKVQATQANPWLTGLGTLLEAGGAVAGAAGGGGAATDASSAEDAAEAATTGGSVAADAAPGGSIALSNALTGLTGEATQGAQAASTAAGLGSITPTWLSSTLNGLQKFGSTQNALARRSQVTSPYINGGQQ